MACSYSPLFLHNFSSISIKNNPVEGVYDGKRREICAFFTEKQVTHWMTFGRQVYLQNGKILLYSKRRMARGDIE